MTEYRVSWTIDIDAASAVKAAREALRIQRDPMSIATIFDVCLVDDKGHPRMPIWTVDLLEKEE